MARIKIEVTAEDIEKGGSGCPVAQALKRATGRDVTVGAAHVRIDDQWIRVPKDAEEFIARCYQALPVEPFAFYLNV